MSGAISLRVLGSNGVPLGGACYDLLESDGSTVFATIQREADDTSAVVVHIPDGEATVTVRASKASWCETRTFGADKVQFDFRSDLRMATSFDQKMTAWSFVVGIVFALILLVLSSIEPEPSDAQRQIWQAILSVSLAGFANGILGLLEVNVDIPKIGLTIRAVGAIGIAVIVFFFVPAFA